MPRLLLSVVLCALIPYTVYAQIPKYNPYFITSAETVEVTPFPLQKLGTMFYDDTWNAGNIFLTNGDTLVAYFIRFDLIRNSLEIIINKKFHTIAQAQLSGFEWFSGARLGTERFIRSDEFDFEDDAYNVEFSQLLVDGPVRLIKVTAVIPRQESNSPSLVPDNARGSNMLILEKYYFEKDGDLFEVGGSKHRNFEFLDSEELENYARDNKLNFSVEGDLKNIVNYLNRMMESNN